MLYYIILYSIIENINFKRKALKNDGTKIQKSTWKTGKVILKCVCTFLLNKKTLPHLLNSYLFFLIIN